MKIIIIRKSTVLELVFVFYISTQLVKGSSVIVIVIMRDGGRPNFSKGVEESIQICTNNLRC